ncbi:MAG: DUF928 domain-containing protein [Gemmatimonadaceae bacterium]|nr:DUF928 domain-containing protein [Gemmatimonadaceae bacterium]
MPHRDWSVRGPLVALVICLAGSSLEAQTVRPTTSPTDRTIRYVKRGAPVRRVSAGVRGHTEVSLDRQVVALLAPRDHIAWTSSEQPDLYWRFAGRSAQVAQAMLIVTRGIAADTLALPRPEPGLQRITLHGTALRLRRGVDHRWAIVIHYDDADLESSMDEAWLRVVPGKVPASAAHDAIAHAQSAAAVGLWYDAFATLTSEYAHDPEDEKLVAMWNTFLSGTVPGLTPPPMRPRSMRP